MTPSPLIDDRTRTDRSRRRSTGNARARAKPLFVRPHAANVAAQRAAGPPIAVLTTRTIAPTASIQTHQASRRDQIPIVLAAPPSHAPPRFRALALFGRRPHQYAGPQPIEHRRVRETSAQRPTIICATYKLEHVVVGPSGQGDVTARCCLWCVTREDEVSCFHLVVASEAGLHHRLVGRRFAILEVTKPPPAGRGVLL